MCHVLLVSMLCNHMVTKYHTCNTYSARQTTYNTRYTVQCKHCTRMHTSALSKKFSISKQTLHDILLTFSTDPGALYFLTNSILRRFYSRGSKNKKPIVPSLHSLEPSGIENAFVNYQIEIRKNLRSLWELKGNRAGKNRRPRLTRSACLKVPYTGDVIYFLVFSFSFSEGRDVIQPITEFSRDVEL